MYQKITLYCWGCGGFCANLIMVSWRGNVSICTACFKESATWEKEDELQLKYIGVL